MAGSACTVAPAFDRSVILPAPRAYVAGRVCTIKDVCAAGAEESVCATGAEDTGRCGEVCAQGAEGTGWCVTCGDAVHVQHEPVFWQTEQISRGLALLEPVCGAFGAGSGCCCHAVAACLFLYAGRPRVIARSAAIAGA